MKPSDKIVVGLAGDTGAARYPIQTRCFAPGNLEAAESQPIGGAVIGRLVEISEAGAPQVDFPENPSGHPIPARALGELDPNDAGRPVVLLFERGETTQPIIIGLLQPQPTSQASRGQREAEKKAIEVIADGEKLVLTARKQIDLKCGKASITLTRAGKILICGEYVLSRSSGVNRIQGGSVQIN
jgi:Domain of unknown function (DUF6484)